MRCLASVSLCLGCLLHLGSPLRGFAGGVADGNSDADVGAIGPHVLPKGIFGTVCALGRELGPTGASF